MLQFFARNGYWIALIIVAVLLWEWRRTSGTFREKVLEVALQTAGIFLAVALAFEQTKYDRQQQRVADAQTLAIAGATSSLLALENLAKVVSVDYDVARTSRWFVVPALLVKASEDEKVLSSLSIDSIKNLTASIEMMKTASGRSKEIFPVQADGSLKISEGIVKNTERPWKELTCDANEAAGKYVASMSVALQEVCGFLKGTGHELPEFLKHSSVSGRDKEPAVFRIEECRISVVDGDPKSAFALRVSSQIRDSMQGNFLDCHQ